MKIFKLLAIWIVKCRWLWWVELAVFVLFGYFTGTLYGSADPKMVDVMVFISFCALLLVILFFDWVASVVPDWEKHLKDKWKL